LGRRPPGRFGFDQLLEQHLYCGADHVDAVGVVQRGRATQAGQTWPLNVRSWTRRFTIRRDMTHRGIE